MDRDQLTVVYSSGRPAESGTTLEVVLELLKRLDAEELVMVQSESINVRARKRRGLPALGLVRTEPATLPFPSELTEWSECGTGVGS